MHPQKTLQTVTNSWREAVHDIRGFEVQRLNAATLRLIQHSFSRDSLETPHAGRSEVCEWASAMTRADSYRPLRNSHASAGLFQLGAAIVHIDGCRPTWPGHSGLLDMCEASSVGSEGRASRRLDSR